MLLRFLSQPTQKRDRLFEARAVFGKYDGRRRVAARVRRESYLLQPPGQLRDLATYHLRKR